MSTFDVTLDQITLDWIRVAATNRVTAEFAESVRAEIFLDEVWGYMVAQLTAQVLAERLPDAQVVERKTFTFSVPSSPWQQYKANHSEAWWLRWLVRRRPTAHTTHRFAGELTADVSRYWAYPEARVTTQMGRAVRVAMIRPTAFWDEVSP